MNGLNHELGLLYDGGEVSIEKRQNRGLVPDHLLAQLDGQSDAIDSLS